MSDHTEFEGVVFGVFGKAVKFQGDFWDEPQFIPVAHCEWDLIPDSDTQGRCRMYIANWLVKKNPGWQ